MGRRTLRRLKRDSGTSMEKHRSRRALQRDALPVERSERLLTDRRKAGAGRAWHETMLPSSDIDSLYTSFCENLPSPLRHIARTLAFRLRLVPEPEIPWSDVFKHAVTLQAPA